MDWPYALIIQNRSSPANDCCKGNKILQQPVINRPVTIIMDGRMRSLRAPLISRPVAYTIEKALPSIPSCADVKIDSCFSSGAEVERLIRAAYIGQIANCENEKSFVFHENSNCSAFDTACIHSGLELFVKQRIDNDRWNHYDDKAGEKRTPVRLIHCRV